MRGHVVGGTLVKLEGNPDSPVGSGRLCAKGVAGIMMLYDPNRLTVPLKRTNPEKGIGVDPKWVEITWEEALDTIVEKMKEVQAVDPRTLFLQSTTTVVLNVGLGMLICANAFGTNTLLAGGGGLHCGQGAHLIGGLMHASWSLVPDWQYCNYALFFGASKGHSAGHVANQNAQGAADARARGMRMVAIDPMCNFASGKASEWLPIRVGTDGALALALANVLVNELGIYDRQHLKRHTNGPYLVLSDGHYCRDRQSNKPLVWDNSTGQAKPFDDPTVGDFAMEGIFTVDGVEARPAFQLLKEHLKKYTPEYAADVTTIAPATIRRIAQEFGEAARVGSTIVVDGHELPYRPVAAIYFRGSQGHRNSTWNCLAIDLLNHLMGAADVPGGVLGFNPVCHGYPGTGRPSYTPTTCPDGLMVTGAWLMVHKPYPAHAAAAPTSFTLAELFPWAMATPIPCSEDQEDWWSKFKLPHRPKMMINCGVNTIMSVGNKDVVADAMKKLDFIVQVDIFLNEMTDFADIVLPDTSYMQRLEGAPNFPFIFNHPAGMGEWGWAIRQPLVAPAGEQRDYVRVMYDILDRLDLREAANIALNVNVGLEGQYRLKPDGKYTMEEVWDRLLRQNFGEEHDLEWFKQHGVLTWPKKVEEVYWRAFVPVRVPIYFEMFQTSGEQVRRVAEQFGVADELEYFTYQPLPDWHPCPSHTLRDPQYDLWAFYYRDTLHTNSLTMENPWLDEASLMNPYTYNVTINREYGLRKRLKDGDEIWVESPRGRRIKGRVKLSEGIHPEGLGVAALCGHWSKDQPVALGKGLFFNELLELDYAHMEPGNGNIDLCVKVKVYKA